jgi:hypothetical protein
MVMHYSTENDEAGVPPTPEKVAEIGKYMEELIAGFAILDVKSKDEAIEHAKRWAQVSGSPKIDVRQVAEFSDFD